MPLATIQNQTQTERLTQEIWLFLVKLILEDNCMNTIFIAMKLDRRFSRHQNRYCGGTNLVIDSLFNIGSYGREYSLGLNVKLHSYENLWHTIVLEHLMEIL